MPGVRLGSGGKEDESLSAPRKLRAGSPKGNTEAFDLSRVETLLPQGSPADLLFPSR